MIFFKDLIINEDLLIEGKTKSVSDNNIINGKLDIDAILKNDDRLKEFGKRLSGVKIENEPNTKVISAKTSEELKNINKRIDTVTQSVMSLQNTIINMVNNSSSNRSNDGDNDKVDPGFGNSNGSNDEAS